MTKRTVAIGYRYPVTYVARGGRTAKTALINSTFDMEIPWLSKEDAPIALTIHDKGGHSMTRRAFKGHCYHSPFMVDRLHGPDLVNSLRLPATTHTILQHMLPNSVYHWLGDDQNAFDVLPLETARVLSDRQQEVEAAVRKAFAKVAIIDERVHVRRRQPMIAVTLANTKSGSRKLYASTRIEMRNTGDRAIEFQFRPERLEEARRFYKAWAKGEIYDDLMVTAVERDTDLLPPASEALVNTEAAANRMLTLLSNFIGHFPDDGYQLLARVGRAHNLAVNDDSSSIPLLLSALDDLEASKCFSDDMFWARTELEFWMPIFRDAVTNSIDYPELAFGRSDNPDLALLTP